MRIAVTGATGMIGRRVVELLLERGDEVTAFTRDQSRLEEVFGERVQPAVWREPESQPAPAQALADRDGVIHLLGENVAQRWTADAKRRIRDSRVLGTRNLVAGMRDVQPTPSVLVSQSASGYYGPRGDERVDETAPPARGDFLADVVVDWEAEAARAEELGVRVVRTRTGVVLSPKGGALDRMLPFFKAGLGGPVAGGRQYVPWIHVDDVANAMLFLLDNEAASGPVNLAAPEPATNLELSKALGRALHRPAFAPVPAFALKALYGEMASVVTTGVREVPKRLEELGYQFSHPALEPALRDVVG
ncbi:MAG TPA: TIGR01777 family oxidoreductase [Thermoleophilaceae bacterium]